MIPKLHVANMFFSYRPYRHKFIKIYPPNHKGHIIMNFSISKGRNRNTFM